MLMKTRKPKLMDRPLSPDLLRKMSACWRAANYLSVGQIYLYDNPLLKKPLKLEHVQEGTAAEWRRVIDTSLDSPLDFPEPGDENPLQSLQYRVAARSIVTLVRSKGADQLASSTPQI